MDILKLIGRDKNLFFEDIQNKKKELKEIIATYGYPDDKVIGGYKIDNQPVDPMILLFHLDLLVSTLDISLVK